MFIAEIIVGICVVAWGFSFFLLAMDFPPSLNPYDFGPGLLPKIISLTQVILGSAWVIQALQRKNKGEDFPIKNRSNILAIMAFLMIYVWCMPKIGYYLSTAFFLPAMLLLATERRWFRVAGITIGFILFAWGTFDLLLKIPLPK